jgi:ABC-2 type transport system ATP-binding protein
MDHLELRDVHQGYGRKPVLQHINLHLTGGVLGLLGRNGAGKTTLLKTMATLIAPTAGTLVHNGVPITDPTAFRRRLGYVPQQVEFYPHWSAARTLRFLAELRGDVPTGAQITATLETVGLTDSRQRVGTYSGGMKRRLALATALLANPAILVVDEPTAGVDPDGRTLIRKILGNISRDRIVVLSTHTISDIEWLADQIVILKHGTVGFAGRPAHLIDAQRQRLWSYTVPLHAGIDQDPSIISFSRQGDVLEIRQIADARPTPEAVHRHPSLEEAYLAFLQA